MDPTRRPTQSDGIDRGSIPSASDLAGILLMIVIIELTAATAFIHLFLGGPLFTLNGLGYVALLAAYVVSVTAPLAIMQRFSWLARLALIAYTLVTIAAYLVIGPYFPLGWAAKAIEVGIVGLLLADLLMAFGGLHGLCDAVLASVSGLGRAADRAMRGRQGVLRSND
jgi:hypothetical protein